MNFKPIDHITFYIIKILFIWTSNIKQSTRNRIGTVLGWLAYKILKFRVRIVRRNFQICFPHLSETIRELWTKEHFCSLGRSLVDRGVLWYGSVESILSITKIIGIERIKNFIAQKRRIILLTPHFLGIDAAGTRLSIEFENIACLYKAPKNPMLNSILNSGRTRFNNSFLIQNKKGLKSMVRHLQDFRPVIYLPDMDFGIKGSVFAPFFGIQTSTLLTTAKLARKWQAVVIPVIVFMERDTGCYQIKIMEELKDFPGTHSLEHATVRLNEEIENWILEEPTQYYWVHRRFKTRPQGERPVY